MRVRILRRWYYISDRYGFRNPESSWQGTPDIATVGDSYTQGNCVDDGHNFVDRLRTDYPKTLNLGQRGNGPFAILASIREYLGERRPKFTIWFHYEGNDIPSDLMRERRTPLFQRYLEPDFSQHLSDNAEAVSAAFARYIDRRLASASEISKNGRNQSQIWLSKVKSKLTLYRLRKRLGFANFPSRELIETFRAVLKRAKSDVARWDGEFLLVYLPTRRRFTSAGERRKLDRYRRRVIGAVRALEIPILDLTTVFETLPKPEQLYDEHLTKAGHAKVAQEVQQFLESRKH